MFSKFFINRPIFATVLALLIVVAGLVTLNILPVAQFPEITPPTVQVSAVYPGANAETVAQTVGIPIEQQVNGVDGMLYMSSNSSSSGAYSLTITFAVGTDIDMATVQVQNRVSIAQSSLPEPVVVQGVTVQKQSSNIVMFLTMTSQDSVYNSLYLTNYAKLNLVDQLTRVPGVGAVNVMGAGDYSMRTPPGPGGPRWSGRWPGGPCAGPLPPPWRRRRRSPRGRCPWGSQWWPSPPHRRAACPPPRPSHRPPESAGPLGPGLPESCLP